MRSKTEIINELKRYFGIKELVCPHIYNRHGEDSWMFLEQKYLETLLCIRQDIVQSAMVCNNWAHEGRYSQRGRRCNLCQIPKDKTDAGFLYVSAHLSGLAGDFSIPGTTAEAVRKEIKDKAYMLPYPIRLEKGVSWLHVDCFDKGQEDKVVEF